MEHLVSDWTASSIFTLQSGLPFTPQLGYNPSGSGDTRNPVRPNVDTGFRGSLYSSGSTAQRATRYFNPAAFSAPDYGTVGNLGRDTLRAPGYPDSDLSLLKTTRVGEHATMQFRAEAFNLINRTNLLTPTLSFFPQAQRKAPPPVRAPR